MRLAFFHLHILFYFFNQIFRIYLKALVRGVKITVVKVFRIVRHEIKSRNKYNVRKRCGNFLNLLFHVEKVAYRLLFCIVCAPDGRKGKNFRIRVIFRKVFIERTGIFKKGFPIIVFTSFLLLCRSGEICRLCSICRHLRGFCENLIYTVCTLFSFVRKFGI